MRSSHWSKKRSGALAVRLGANATHAPVTHSSPHCTHSRSPELEELTFMLRNATWKGDEIDDDKFDERLRIEVFNRNDGREH